MSEGYVYFIRPVGQQGPVKIGYSAQLPERRKRLQREVGGGLVVEVAVMAASRFEIIAHRFFADSHFKGEWFHRSEKLDRVIRALRNGASLADVITESDARYPCNRQTFPAWKREKIGLMVRLSHAGARHSLNTPAYRAWFSLPKKQTAGRPIPADVKTEILEFLKQARP